MTIHECHCDFSTIRFWQPKTAFPFAISVCWLVGCLFWFTSSSTSLSRSLSLPLSRPLSLSLSLSLLLFEWSETKSQGPLATFSPSFLFFCVRVFERETTFGSHVHLPEQENQGCSSQPNPTGCHCMEPRVWLDCVRWRRRSVFVYVCVCLEYRVAWGKGSKEVGFPTHTHTHTHTYTHAHAKCLHAAPCGMVRPVAWCCLIF